MIGFPLVFLLLNVVIVDQMAGFGGVAHMDPHSTVTAVFEEQLVHVHILFEDVKQAAAVVIALDVDVRGKAHDVFAVTYTAHDAVQLTAAVAARDMDRVAKGDARRLEDVAAEGAQILDLLLFRHIVHLHQFGTHRADKLVEREVVGQ